MGEILYGNAIHIREQSKIDAQRVTRKSGNERRGAESALTRFSASLGNSRRMESAGRTVNNITENIARNMDAATFGTLQSRIGAAEELGAHAAAAASMGMGGSSVEAYAQTLRIQQSMIEEQSGRSVNSDLIGASNARGDAITDAVSGLDNNRYFADQDYTINVDHQKMGTLTKLFTLGAAAAATYFGGPQAGMAVIGVGEAGQKAKNGDYGGASSDLTGAVTNAFGAAKTTYSMQDAKPGFDSYWSSVKQTSKSIRIK